MVPVIAETTEVGQMKLRTCTLRKYHAQDIKIGDLAEERELQGCGAAAVAKVGLRNFPA